MLSLSNSSPQEVQSGVDLQEKVKHKISKQSLSPPFQLARLSEFQQSATVPNLDGQFVQYLMSSSELETEC